MPDNGLEIVDLRESRDEALLEEIYDGLYKRSFPFEDEREDMDFWRENLWEPKPGSLVVHFLVARRDGGPPAAQDVAGFIASEYYPRSRAGLVTYIGVEKHARGAGVGRRLMDAAYAALESDAAAAGATLRAVFAEIHEPTRIEPNKDSVPPRDRVAIMGRLGARRVPIPYVQPALGENGKRADGLMLVAFPSRRDDFALQRTVDSIPAETVRAFLDELYEASEERSREEREADRDFARMLNDLHGEVELEDLLSEEDPESALPLETYGIAFHLAVWPPADAGPVPQLEPSKVEIDSFERDVLAYAYRDARPFTTQVDLLPAIRELELRFPAQISFVAEGRPVTLLRSGTADGGERRVALRIARTDFRSGVSILHLVIRPGLDPEPSVLSEYEVIKLAKFWEGGEGIHEPAVEVTDSALFTVVCADSDDETTLLAIAHRAIGNRGELEPLRAGTVQVLVDPAECERLCDAVRQLKLHEGAARLDARNQRRVTAVGGILQGLLDFEEIDLDELSDVFKDVEPETSRIDSIKKGTLFSLTHEDRGFDAAETVGVSPYLLIPHAVLLHNEVLLTHAAELASVERAGRGGLSPATFRAYAAARWQNRLARTERNRREIARLLNNLVPNVFHYDAEQRLFENGWRSRGLESLKQEVESRLAELGTDIDKRHARLRDIAAQTIALLLLTFTAVQAADQVSTAVVIPISVVIGLLYLALILRR